MKLGCCLNMFGSREDPLGMHFLSALAEIGYEYAELPLAQMMELTGEEHKQIFRALKQEGVPCEACNNFFPGSLRLTGTDISREKIGEYGRKAVELAAEAGAKVIVLGSSGAKNVPPGFPMEKAMDQLKQLLEDVERWVEPYEILVALEPINRQEGNIIQTLQQAEELRRAAGCPHIRLLVDYYHLEMEQEPWEHVEDRMEQVAHVHMAEGIRRGFPEKDGKGLEFLKALETWEYRHRVSLEAVSSCPREDLQKMRQLWPKEKEAC